jgi:hypothetical protein
MRVLKLRSMASPGIDFGREWQDIFSTVEANVSMSLQNKGTFGLGFGFGLALGLGVYRGRGRYRGRVRGTCIPTRAMT